MNLFIIDTLAPFFSPLPEGGEYNWSKVPFTLLEEEGGIPKDREKEILASFRTYIARVKNLGYNSITLDELCRMVSFDFYSRSLREKLARYSRFYKKLIAEAEKEDLKVFITTDIMFYNSDIKSYIKKKGRKDAILAILKSAIRKLIYLYPEVSGVLFRLGESDGMDVQGDFLSHLYVKTPRQCRMLIRELLPLFEESEKLLIVRSWTLGAYPIGDLIWNEETMNKVFGNMESDNLIVSHKFGETDFFRYLNLNPHFFREGPKKIIELQARREYEGFGEFPAYTGKDYEKIHRYLQSADNMEGIMVWAQTGGWSHFGRLTYVRNSSIWVELNCEVTISIFREGLDSDNAVLRFAKRHLESDDTSSFLKLVRLSEKIIRMLWYIPEFSSRRMYFRRSRIPTLLWIVWDNIIISHTLRKIIRPYVLEKKEAIIDGYRTLGKIRKLKSYARKLGLPEGDFQYMYDTFEIIAHGREYYLGRWNPGIQEKITDLAENYSKKYPRGFHIIREFSLVQPKKWLIKTLFRLAIREFPRYRLIDKLVLIRFSSLIYFLVSFRNRGKLPDFLEENAMGVQTLLK